MKKVFTPLLTLLFTSILLVNVSAQTVIYTEGFDYSAGTIPPGWVIDAEQPPSWSVNVSQMAGGTAPELYLGYSMAAGLSRLVSPEIDVTGQTGLIISYLQFLINYEMDFGEIIGMDITFDGGTSWQTLWEQPLSTLNIVQGEYAYYFAVPSGATTVQYAFRYDGNCYAINLWCIDNIKIETVVNNDLLVASFGGNITPSVGKNENYTIEIINGGLITQNDYTVGLYKEGGELLSSVQGSSIDFAEKVTYDLTWTPEEDETGNTVVYAVVQLNGDEAVDNDQSELLPVTVQTEDIEPIEIGENFTPVKFVPYNFFQLYSHTQTLYLADEIDANGEAITGIKYTAQFDEDEEGVEIHLMLGETEQNNLTDDWLDPAAFTEVFNGTVNFRKGLNDFFIPFDNAYTYNGGNLIVQSVKSYTVAQLFTSFICTYDTASQRSRAAERDDQPFNPLSIPPWGYCVDLYPNITLLYSNSTVNTSEIQQTVHNVAIYPNPANDFVKLQSDETIVEVKIFNLMGQLVKHQAPGTNEFDLSVTELKSGTYVAHVQTAKGLSTQKIHVIK
ncbi:MAG: T9SS type A sorting domain-containing protein [Bacteroidales bacterium]|nr:T9SS type A sorting domain-containing protein [Bacteroidales bacterium]HOI31840.1 T9SS type A sorting domain-containing protein [Bacteroidales bacterium]